MSLSQNRPVVPPSKKDSGLLDFAQIIQKGLEVLYQAGHVHKIVTVPPAAKDGAIGDIYIVNTATDTYLTIKTAAGWISQANGNTITSASLAPTVFIGPIRPENFSLSVTTGGTLAPDTYIYKIYPFDSNGFVGKASPETTIVVTAGHQTVNMTWTASPGTSYYRIQRANSTVGSGGYNGWFQVAGTSTSFSDSGQAFTGAPPIIVASQQLDISMGGGIQMQAGIGSLQWINYSNGLIGGSVGCTSAGEMEFVSGLGVFPGHYYFDTGSGSAQLVTIDTSQTINLGGRIAFGDAGALQIGTLAGSKLQFWTGSPADERVTIDDNIMNIKTVNLKYTKDNVTGSQTATLGTNGPMVTTTPYTWVKVFTADGSTGYMPIWK